MRVRAMLSLFSLAGAALVAPGCRSTTGPAGGPARELARREAQWRAQGVHDYAFDYDLHAMANSPGVRITVHGDVATQVVVRATGEALANPERWPTVDSLFVEAQRVIEHDRFHPTVLYDAARGFPTEIDAPSDVPDTGFTVDVSNFIPAS